MSKSSPESFSLTPAAGTFPIHELRVEGLWASLSPNAKALLPVIWDFHRMYPDACHPSRQTLASEAGISPPSVSKAIKELERVGILHVVRRPGTLPNTYKLGWSNIKVPIRAKKGRSSHYALPRQERDVDLFHDEQGRDRVTHSKRRHQGHHMADGCVVASAHEAVIHEHLVQWRIPHWCGIRYIDLGIRITDPKTGNVNARSTVDFLLGPGLLLERIGLPPTQAKAHAYRTKLKRKLAAARDAGWAVIDMEPDRRPGPWLVQPILDAWATATIEDAERLKRLLERPVSGHHKWDDGSLSALLLKRLVGDALDRLEGKAEPKSPAGLVLRVQPAHGPAVDKTRFQPDLVLMESAGRDSVDAPGQEDDGFAIDLDPAQHHPPEHDLGQPIDRDQDHVRADRLGRLRNQLCEIEEDLDDLHEDDEERFHLIEDRGRVELEIQELESARWAAQAGDF